MIDHLENGAGDGARSEDADLLEEATLTLLRVSALSVVKKGDTLAFTDQLIRRIGTMADQKAAQLEPVVGMGDSKVLADQLREWANGVREEVDAKLESENGASGAGSAEKLLRDGIFELPFKLPGGGRPRVAVDEDGVVQAVVGVTDDRDSEAVDVFLSGLTGSATDEDDAA